MRPRRHAPAEVIVDRYGARLSERHPGHPGAEYLQELPALVARARPLGRGPLVEVDISRDVDITALAAWVRNALAG